MPLVRAINPVPGGYEIVTTRGGTHTFTSADIPAGMLNRPLSELSDFATQFLSSKMSGAFVAVHIVTLTPLVCNVLVSNEPITNPLWWDITRGGAWPV